MTPNGYFEAGGTIASASAGTILSAPPAGFQHIIQEFQVQLEGTGPQAVVITGGSVARRVYCAAAGDGFAGAVAPNKQDNTLWHLAPGSALVVTASGSALFNYYVRGYTAPVF